jgi:hypothetical protein
MMMYLMPWISADVVRERASLLESEVREVPILRALLARYGLRIAPNIGVPPAP